LKNRLRSRKRRKEKCGNWGNKKEIEKEIRTGTVLRKKRVL